MRPDPPPPATMPAPASGLAAPAGRAGGFRVFNHTADVGLSIRGATLGDLFLWAAAGLARLSLRAGRLAGATRDVPVALPPAPDPEALLVAWLNYLIYILDTERLVGVGGRLDVAGGDDGWTLSGTLSATVVPPRGVRITVKAASYHGLRITRRQGLYRARIILDV